ncbi:MAG: Asp-tRNA(Asn)/Glu-tRNA(Gln) amidotransferase A subunit family amidase [Alphaproteobacteria bacterium]|jgi:Asp-tRNA(Asn)/Glu-tRNA(Gln) amidotransferase A subunit family amidase
MSERGRYDPEAFEGLSFHDAARAFSDGADTPRDYLERCLAEIALKEPSIKAFVAMNEDGARKAADESTVRWKEGRALSSIDGMPIGIKDLLETRDMPTQMGCDAYIGNFPKRDNAAVWALREAGAVVLCKTVTAELGGSQPGGDTVNPFDAGRTAGGSSTGSAAAVGSGMLPAAIGTQVGGSIIRPAAYCGNVALKPTQGGINRGERQATSMSTHGVHGTCVEDMWRTAIEIAKRAGGDRGCLGLFGPDQAPAASKPHRLVVLEGDGWAVTDDDSKAGFESILEQLQSAGVEVLRRGDHPYVDALERAVEGAGGTCNAITGWENRWAQRNLVNEHPNGVSERLKARLAKAEAMTPDDYRAALLTRGAAQGVHESLTPFADAVIGFSCPGPAPLWSGDVPGEALAPRPTGDAICNTPSSMLFAPVVTMPLLGIRGMPVGVQVMGQQHSDARMAGIARWMLENITPVTVN